MPRLARLVVPEMPHHVIQRGNRRQDVFFNDGDRRAYLAILHQACERHGVAIWAYCLMRNHVHFVAVPQGPSALARCFGEAHLRYTRRINVREQWQGHLWQARFGSSVMDDRYLLAAVRYIERNPVAAGIVDVPWRYAWSSAAWHVGERAEDPLVSGDELLRSEIGDWRSYLQQPDLSQETTPFERDTVVSRPLGDDKFVAALEQRFHRRLRQREVGRPRKSVAVPN